MSILLIEFDQATYNNEVMCRQWLRRQPEYLYLLDCKTFKLTSKAKSIFMSLEGRKVYSWASEDLWRYKHFSMHRPEPHILIIFRDLGDTYTESDIPALSSKTQSKRREKERRQAEADHKKLNRSIISSNKRKQRSKTVAKVVIEDPLEKAEAEAKAKISVKKRKAEEKKESSPKKRIPIKKKAKADLEGYAVDLPDPQFTPISKAEIQRIMDKDPSSLILKAVDIPEMSDS